MSRQQSRETKNQFEAAAMFVDEQPANGVSLRRAPQVTADVSATAPPSSVPSLSTAERADLERLARHQPTGLARRAGIILARADRRTLTLIGRRFNVHPDTVRRWLIRYKQRGLAGLRHGNLGKSRNLVFDAPLRMEIRRLASTDPLHLGEAFSKWSLLKLRGYLIRHRVVHTISHEALRQMLLTGPSSHRYWRNNRGGDGRA